jgi:hypothetical protein
MNRADVEKIVESFDSIKNISDSQIEFLARFYLVNCREVITKQKFADARREKFPNMEIDYDKLELLNWAYDFFMKPQK